VALAQLQWQEGGGERVHAGSSGGGARSPPHLREHVRVLGRLDSRDDAADLRATTRGACAGTGRRGGGESSAYLGLHGARGRRFGPADALRHRGGEQARSSVRRLSIRSPSSQHLTSRTLRASSSRPLVSSQRGEKGVTKTKAMARSTASGAAAAKMARQSVSRMLGGREGGGGGPPSSDQANATDLSLRICS